MASFIEIESDDDEHDNDQHNDGDNNSGSLDVEDLMIPIGVDITNSQNIGPRILHRVDEGKTNHIVYYPELYHN